MYKVKPKFMIQPKYMKPKISALFALFAIAVGAGGDTVETSVMLSNRYVTEGIDNVPESSSFLLGEVATDLGPVTLGAFYVQSLGNAYNEVNLFAEHGNDLGPIEWYAGLQFLTFPAPGDADTWEVYLGFECPIHDHIVLFGEAYYDFDEVRGGFIEFGASFPLPTPTDWDGLGWHPYVLMGMDCGFVSGPRRLRANHLQFGIEAEYSLNDNIAFIASLNRSQRLSNLRAAGEGNFYWGEAGVLMRF